MINLIDNNSMVKIIMQAVSTPLVWKEGTTAKSSADFYLSWLILNSNYLVFVK